ncbi:response regulator [Nitrospira sp. Nam74]
MLLVEDDRRTALAYESLLALQRPDIAIDTVFSAQRALLCLSEMAYDVILSDFKLPGLDGLGLLVATYCLHSRAPFLLISAHGDRELEDRAIRVGAYAVLHKPIAPRALMSVIERALTKAAPTIERRRSANGIFNNSIREAKKDHNRETRQSRNNR